MSLPPTFIFFTSRAERMHGLTVAALLARADGGHYGFATMPNRSVIVTGLFRAKQ
jgi:hypothetical protein